MITDLLCAIDNWGPGGNFDTDIGATNSVGSGRGVAIRRSHASVHAETEKLSSVTDSSGGASAVGSGASGIGKVDRVPLLIVVAEHGKLGIDGGGKLVPPLQGSRAGCEVQRPARLLPMC